MLKVLTYDHIINIDIRQLRTSIIGEYFLSQESDFKFIE